MFKNYVTIAIRSILKNKLFATINIAGLSIGLAIFIFAQLFAGYERNHDAFFENSDRIYAVYSNVRPEANLGINVIGSAYTTIGPLMDSELSGVDATARLMASEFLAGYGDKKFYQSIRFGDPAFLDIFQFDYVAGDPSLALAEPSGLVITESAAEKYFGTENPLGQVITFRNQHDL